MMTVYSINNCLGGLPTKAEQHNHPERVWSGRVEAQVWRLEQELFPLQDTRSSRSSSLPPVLKTLLLRPPPYHGRVRPVQPVQPWSPLLLENHDQIEELFYANSLGI